MLIFPGGAGGAGGPSRSIEKSGTGSALSGDRNKFIRFTNGVSDISYTIENDGAGGLTFPVDTEMYYYREGTGEVTINKGASVIFEGPAGGDAAFKISGTKNTMAWTKKLAANRWAYGGGVKLV